ncbi:MAG: hypothetical protein ACRDYC_00200, partial [Acidimicrobiales bacterium]
VVICATCVLASTACTATPYAATVGEVGVSQARLYHELDALAGNGQYVSAINDQGNEGTGVFVQGDAHDTYSAEWVAEVLTQLVVATAVTRRLAKLHESPSPADLAAAQAVDAAEFQHQWEGFSPAFRAEQVLRDADLDMLASDDISPATAHAVYAASARYFFTQICVREVTAVNLGLAAEAQSNLDASGALGTALAGEVSSTRGCFDPTSLGDQSSDFAMDVLTLAPGKASPPEPRNGGYQVIEVTSRRNLPYGPAVAKALSVALDQAQGTPDPVLTHLLASIDVEVNPAFGTWTSGVYGYGVVPQTWLSPVGS